MTALFIVRAEVAEPDRAGFDRWYATEHLPQAMEAFGTTRARRGWSDIDAGVHIAIYEFASIAEARKIVGGDAGPQIKAMIAEFDHIWQGRVTRSRELIEIAQELEV